MSDNYREDAVKQYLRHFRVWFIIVAIAVVITLAAGIIYAGRERGGQINSSAPKERVYDKAGILTDAEEEKLREYIAKKEAQYRVHFVILTFSQPVEGQTALEYGCRSTDWERNMMDIADDFWDENGYGYNRDFEGDGSILIDNRYPGQKGEWLSTSGKVEDALSTRAVENVLYAVDDYYDSDPCRAYMRYIDKVCSYLGGGVQLGGVYYLGAFVVSLIIAGAYAASHLGKNRAQDTTAVNAYVAGGKPVMDANNQRDDFIRKSVVKRKIETSSGSGGGRSSGGGGHHTSSGGASHGGGGHRH